MVPVAVVTSTLTALPAVPAGVVAVMVLSLSTVKLVAATPPMVTPVAPVKSAPVMVIIVPPAVDPLVGEILFTVGAGVTATEAVCPVNAMLFKSTLEVLSKVFAVMMSSLPSLFTSPKVKKYGPLPVAKVCWPWKVPSPLPRSTLVLAEP